MKGEVPVSVDFDFIIRIGVAGLLGAMIGIEKFDRKAGLKTHFLVAVGSALIMVVSKYAFQILCLKSICLVQSVRKSLVELVLGAGTIIIQKQAVKGLTTAAGLWATAGMISGQGMCM